MTFICVIKNTLWKTVTTCFSTFNLNQHTTMTVDSSVHKIYVT